MPGELPGVDIQRQRRAGVERIVLDRHAPADRHPGLRLRRSPVSQIQIGIVAAGDPRLAARPEQVRELAPGVSAGFPLLSDRVEPPQLLARRRIVRADEALLFPVGLTSAKSLNHLALRHDRAAARAVVALRPIADRGLPHGLAGLRVERDQPRVAGCRKHLVVVDGDPAHRGAVRVRAVAVFPDQVAGTAIDRLHDVAGVVEIDDPVVNDRRRLIRATFIHGPDPLQAQVLHIVARDLVQ